MCIILESQTMIINHNALNRNDYKKVDILAYDS